MVQEVQWVYKINLYRIEENKIKSYFLSVKTGISGYWREWNKQILFNVGKTGISSRIE